MKYIANHMEMKEIDGYTIQTIGIPSIVLMERAAESAVAVMMERIHRRDRILAICGTGNNGGDGAAMARILKINGFSVDVMLPGDEGKATNETKKQVQIARNLGIRILNKANIGEYTVIIDAIFGIGLSKDVTGNYAEVIASINKVRDLTNALVYSVDVPSGIHAGNGKIMGTAVKADYTITFGVQKLGLTLYPGYEYGGGIVVADIGFPAESLKAANLNTFFYEEEDVPRLLPKRRPYSHKGNYGKVLVVAGSKGMSGAAYLSAKAAYRTGAGLVKVLTVEENRTILQTELPEAILSTYEMEDGGDGAFEEQIMNEMTGASAIVIGPGMGTLKTTERILDIVLRHANVPVIIDADALNVMGKRPDLYKVGKITILTPHLKEMAGLIRVDASVIASDLLGCAKRFIRDGDCTLVLKDARTLVLKGDWTYINVSGNNGMATGGSGDVLTGVIAALVAQGKEPFEAAALGVFIHGLAGDYVRKETNPYSLLASDVIEALPHVLQ